MKSSAPPHILRTVRPQLAITVLLLAAYLRFANLESNPGWYTDEGAHLEIARHLVEGEWRYFAIEGSTLLFAKLPVFEWLLAGMMRLVGPRMLALRLLTAALGVIGCALVYALALHIYRGRSRTLPVIAALLYAVYPQAVIYSRFGFSYNLLAVWALLALVCLLRGLRRGDKRWLGAMSVAIGLGALTDLMALTMLPVFVAALALKKPRALVWTLPLMALPWAIFAGSLLISAPQAFIFDMTYTLGRVGGLNALQQISNVIQNGIRLARIPWIPIGVVGLTFTPDRRARWLLIGLWWLPVIALGRVVALFHLSFYYMIPLLPLTAIGAAALLDAGARLAARVVGRGAIRRYAAGGVALIIALLSFARLNGQIRSGFDLPINGFLVPAASAYEAAAFLNARITPCDLTIASPGVGWLIDGQVADFQMPGAYAGIATPHLPADAPPDRWAFEPRIDRVSYAVVDELWYAWAVVHAPGIALWLDEVETWPVAFESAGARVYRNPSPLAGRCVARQNDYDRELKRWRRIGVTRSGASAPAAARQPVPIRLRLPL